MATELKFCGMRREADILAANACLPDYIGFVFAAGARRAVTPEAARELRAKADPRILAVGVFADQSPAYIAELAAMVPLDVIQLHGSESEVMVEEIRRRTGKPVWRDGILLDSGKGSGKTFAWEWLRDFSRPYMLAGGLDIENVGEAIKTFSPRGVDVSSALETDGKKDPEKMRAFAEAVRRADSEAER